MPTPFMHLDIAEKILAAVDDPAGEHGRLHTPLLNNLPAFYYGSIAPDFQIVCNLPRIESHFYPIPSAPDDDAFANMLEKYPALRNVKELDEAQAVFIAAYGAHLLLDLIWFHEILIPYFVKPPDLGDRPHRSLLHLTVLAYLDSLSYQSLPNRAAETLFAAQPNGWLPFGGADALVEWRDLVANQLLPENDIETSKIFAGRLNMSPAIFVSNMNDATWMDQHVFNQIPVPDIQAILNTAVSRSIQLITDYLYPIE
jgi:hypothetical protein